MSEGVARETNFGQWMVAIDELTWINRELSLLEERVFFLKERRADCQALIAEIDRGIDQRMREMAAAERDAREDERRA